MVRQKGFRREKRKEKFSPSTSRGPWALSGGFRKGSVVGKRGEGTRRARKTEGEGCFCEKSFLGQEEGDAAISTCSVVVGFGIKKTSKPQGGGGRDSKPSTTMKEGSMGKKERQ